MTNAPTSGGRSWVDDLEAEELLKGIEVAIVVKQTMVVQQTERCDPRVDGRAHDSTPPAQRPIVERGGQGQVHAARGEHFEPQKPRPDLSKSAFVPKPLQDLAQDDVEESQPLTIDFSIQPLRLGRPGTIEVVDPDRAVDDDHRSRSGPSPRGSHGSEITAPPDLAAQGPDAALPMDLAEETKPRLNGGALGAEPSGLHGRLHEPVVDDDVRPHVTPRAKCVDNSTLCVLANLPTEEVLVVDVLYAYLNPKIRYSS